MEDIDNETLAAVAEMAKISAKSENDLPDSAFAIILPGGKKDAEGKTVPRSLRMFPIHDAAHARNALARLPQSHLTSAQKAEARAKIIAACKKFGVKVSSEMMHSNPTDEETTMADENKEKTPDTKPAPKKDEAPDPVAALLAEIKTKFSKDEAAVAMTAKFEEAIALAKKESETKAAEIEKKLADAAKLAEEQKLTLTKHAEALKLAEQREAEAQRKAEFASIENQLSKIAHARQMDVLKRWGVLPKSGERLFELEKLDDQGKIMLSKDKDGKDVPVKESLSLLHFAVEYSLAAPDFARPKGMEEDVTKHKATTKKDVDDIKLRLAAFEEVKKDQGLKGDDLKREMDAYQATLVSPN